ncbi:MAG: hypothetical protein RQ867_10315 [Mariprofundaceae bacterium]|nr:hypothetical protein [Mariprofundaceae bacterium]
MVLVAALLLAGCQSSATKPLSEEDQIKRVKLHYQIGLDALHKNQLPKAFDELMKAEAIDPHDVEVLSALGYAWRLRGNFKKSESYYLRAIRSGATSSIYTNYGSLLLEMKRYADAKVQLDKALEDPRYRNQFVAYINLGDALLGLGQFDDAIAAYRQAGLFNTGQSFSRIKEAAAYVSFKRYNYAQALYETILRENSRDRTALEGLVRLLKLRNDNPAARKHLKAFQEGSTSALDRAWAADELDKLR